MYFKCRADPSLPLRLFDEMPRRNVVSWSAAMAGLVQSHLPDQALSLFRRMQRDSVRPNGQVIRLGLESNVFLVNACLTALIWNGRFTEAAEMFEQCRNKDVVSWNSMIAGYLQFSYYEIWEFWCRMNREGVSPDGFSFSSIFTGLAATSSLKGGEQVHAQLVKYGFGDDLCVGNSLVDMYLKNRDLVAGFKAFNEMVQRDVVSWIHMVVGCLHCGQPSKALDIVYQMKALCTIEST